MPTAGPLTLAITSLGTLRTRAIRGWKDSRSGPITFSAPSGPTSPLFRSAPEEKARPAPVNTITRASGSAAACSSAASMSSLSRRVHAFSASGRLRTMVATPESSRSWTVSSSMVVIVGSVRPSAPSGSQHRVAVVALDHADRPLRRGLQAQLAEHALVEVLRDDLDPLLAGVVDVDGADVGELGGDVAIARDRWVDLDG